MKSKIITLAFFCAIPSVATTATQKNPVESLQCLTANIFFEARGETVEGMKAVAKVTMNRVKSKKYPTTVCATVFQHKQFSWVHQQSFKKISAVLTGNIERLNELDRKAYQKSVIIAQQALSNDLRMKQLDKALWYHATYVNPSWAARLKKVAKINTHIFYESRSNAG